MDINEVASAIKHSEGENMPVLVAIEGYGGSGKSTLAEKLKQLLRSAEAIKMTHLSSNNGDPKMQAKT